MCIEHISAKWWSRKWHGSGGYGMLIGPAATKATIEAFATSSSASREGFIAQPTLALSTCPTCTASGLAPRHVDLRPFVLTGARPRHHRSGRADPRGAEGRLAGGQFEPGRRHQGHLDESLCLDDIRV